MGSKGLIVRFLIAATLVAATARLAAATPLGTAFTYQGEFLQGAAPGAGNYLFRFALYDAVTSGKLVAGPITNSATVGANGLFTVAVDFGAPFFGGNASWLEIAACTNAAGSNFVVLTPRQPLTAVPNAQFSVTAGNATGVQAGTVAAAQLATTGSPSAGQVLAFSGSALVWTNASTSWSLAGNSGTTPGVNFVGTADSQALEFRANNQRALRLEPGSAGSPNVIGGSVSNVIASGTTGAIIAGGATNRILGASPVATISGGYWGLISSNSPGATIGGGHNNSIGMQAPDATIVGGAYNVISDYVYEGVVGGYGNVLGWNAIDGVVCGGTWNEIADSAYQSFIGGGLGNTNAGVYSVINGGTNNFVDATSTWSVVGGGANNAAQNGYGVTVGGGCYNNAYGASYATVGGGYDNWVQSSAPYSTIPGGSSATTRSYGQFALASGSTATYGDAQASLYVLRNTTSGAGTFELFLDGASARMMVPTNGAWTFQVMVVGRTSAGTVASYQASGAVKSSATGVVTLVGTTPVFTVIANEISGLTTAPGLYADTANGSLDIRVSGVASSPIRWVARVQTVEVSL